MISIKTPLAKLLLSSFALIVLSCFASAVKADEAAQPPRFVVEANMATGDAFALPITEELRPGRSLPSGTLGLRASVSLPWADQDVLAEQTGLLVQKTGPTSVSLNPASDNPGSQNQPKDDLLGYDQLWVDYNTDVTQRQCAPTATLRASGVDRLEKDKPALTLHLRTAQAGRRSERLDLSGGHILPRDNLYLVRRQTGIGADPDWRVVQDQQNLIYMRLLRLDLHSLEMLEMEMSPDVQQVNLRLSQDSRGRPTDVLSWDAVPKEIRDTGHSKVVRLYLGEVLQQRFAETLQNDKPLSLVEVIAFVPADKSMARVNASLTAPVTAARVFRREKQDAAHAKTIFLPSETERTGPGSWRWKISLAPLQAIDLREARLIDGQLSMVPTSAEQTCIADIRHVSLVGLFKKRQPAVFAEINRTTRQWGGPFGLAEEGGNKLEWPHIFAQLPFTELAGRRQEKVTLPTDQEYDWPGLGFSLKVVGGGKPGIATLDSRGLSVVNANMLEARWNVSIKLPEHAHLFLQLGSNGVSLPPGSLVLHFADGTDNVAYFPGQTADLGKYAGRHLRQVTFRLPLDPADESIVLKDAILFDVTAVLPHESLQAAEPGWRWVPTATLAMAQPDTQPNSGEIIQIHPLHERASNFAALRLRYDISQTPRDTCWLQVTLRGARHSVGRRLCLPGSEGEQVIPFLDITSRGFNADESLREVEWTIRDDALPSGGRVRLDVDRAILNAPSVADRFRDNVEVSLNGRALPLPPVQENFWRDLANGRAWLNFDGIAWPGGAFDPKLNTSGLPVQVTEWRLQYRSGQAQRISDWLRNDSGADADSEPSKWLVPLLFILLASLAVLRWRAGAIQRGAASLWSDLGAHWRHIAAASTLLGQAMAQFIHSQRHVLNIALLGLAWWLTLRFYRLNPFLPNLDAALLGLGLASLLGIWHAWRWQIEGKSLAATSLAGRWLLGTRYRPPHLLWLMSAVVLGSALVYIIGSAIKQSGLDPFFEIAGALSATDLAFFSAGVMVQLALTIAAGMYDAWWSPLLLALMYGFLPWLATWGAWLISPAGRTPRWTMISVALYILGITRLGQSGENYYFTFGGVATVLAWRSWLADLRPRIESRWPRIAVIYNSSAGIYFGGALAGLLITALLLIPQWTVPAEQVAVVVYYFLVIGIILEIRDQRRKTAKPAAAPALAKDTPE